MSNYFEDLVQNIYTNCDMSGFEDLKRGYLEAESLSRASKKEEYQSQKQRLKMLETEEKMRVRLGYYKEVQAIKAQNALDRENAKLGTRNKLLQKATRFVMAYFSIQTLKNIINTGTELQLVQKSIEGLTKSTEDWDFISKASYKLGLSLKTAAEGYKNFYSSANMAGFDKGSIQGMYYDVILASRAIGASEQQTGGALLALEQMLSKGTGSMEELRRQLGNAIPGAFEIGAKAMKMTTKEFNEFVKKGQLASNVFVPLFIKTLKETYANGFKDIEQTVAVAQGRLKNAWENFTIEFISGDAGKSLAKGLNDLAEILKSPEFKQFVSLLGIIFSWVVKILRFAMKYLPFILIYLGIKGVNGALIKLIGNMMLLQLSIFQATGNVLTFGRMATLTFRTVGTAIKGAILPFLKWLSILSLIVDIIGGIGQHFWGWKVHTMLGDLLDTMDANKKIEDVPATDLLKLPPEVQKKLNKLMQDKKFRKYYEDLSIKAGQGDVEARRDLLHLLKTGSQASSITGTKEVSYNIEVNINANNMTAEQAKVVFADTMSNLLLSQEEGVAI